MRRLFLFLTAATLAAALFSGCKCRQAEPEAPAVRNVIYMIGDGMGIAHISSMMAEGEYAPVNFERATTTGLVKTYSADDYVTDSAAGGTALATGCKTHNGMVGMNPDSTFCHSVLHDAAGQGWATGIVVTSYLTDATPASFYAHVPSRKMLDDIAVQLVGSDVDVAIGGGIRYFSPEYRKDGRDVLAELSDNGYTVVTDFAATEGVTKGRLVALTTETFMDYSQDGRGDYLSQATSRALEILGNNSGGKGIFLMVEGSLIDYAAHDNDAPRTISETRDFDRAIGLAFDYADSHPGTLVVITADHETGGLTMPSSQEPAADGRRGMRHAFSTDGHTGSMVPLFAYGTCADSFSGVLDNTDVARIIRELISTPGKE